MPPKRPVSVRVARSSGNRSSRSRPALSVSGKSTKTAPCSRSYFSGVCAEQDLVDLQVGVEVELDAGVVLEHLEADRVLAADALLVRIDADVEVVGQQVVVGAIQARSRRAGCRRASGPRAGGAAPGGRRAPGTPGSCPQATAAAAVNASRVRAISSRAFEPAAGRRRASRVMWNSPAPFSWPPRPCPAWSRRTRGSTRPHHRLTLMPSDTWSIAGSLTSPSRPAARRGLQQQAVGTRRCLGHSGWWLVVSG